MESKLSPVKITSAASRLASQPCKPIPIPEIKLKLIKMYYVSLTTKYFTAIYFSCSIKMLEVLVNHLTFFGIIVYYHRLIYPKLISKGLTSLIFFFFFVHVCISHNFTHSSIPLGISIVYFCIR